MNAWTNAAAWLASGLLLSAALAQPAAEPEGSSPDAGASEATLERNRALTAERRPVPEPMPGAGSSVFFRIDPMLVDEQGNANDARLLARVSTYHVAPPEPKVLAKHDLVTIIVDESSRQSSTQSLETEKKGNIGGRFSGSVDPWKLLQLRLQNGTTRDINLVDLQHDRKYEAEGTAESENRMSARITARIVDVKPNGTLVLEARKVIESDDNTETFLLTGLARREDVTDRNTILSSQLAELEVTRTNDGEVRKSTKKGIISRALEAIFAF